MWCALSFPKARASYSQVTWGAELGAGAGFSLLRGNETAVCQLLKLPSPLTPCLLQHKEGWGFVVRFFSLPLQISPHSLNILAPSSQVPGDKTTPEVSRPL